MFSRYRAWRTDVSTGRHVTTTIFEIDGLPSFLRYEAPLESFRRAGAPLSELIKESVNVTLLIISAVLG